MKKFLVIVSAILLVTFMGCSSTESMDTHKTNDPNNTDKGNPKTSESKNTATISPQTTINLVGKTPAYSMDVDLNGDVTKEKVDLYLPIIDDFSNSTGFNRPVLFHC